MPPSLQHVPGSHLVRLPCRTVRELITCVLSPHCRATEPGSTGTVEHKLAGPIPMVRVTGGHEDDLPLGLGGGGTACPGRGRIAQAKRWEEGGERAQGVAQAHSPSRNTRATHDGGTGSLPVHPDSPVSLASLTSLLCGGQGQEELCSPRSSRTPSLPHPCAKFPSGPQAGGIHRGAPRWDPRVWGRGRPRRTKSLDGEGTVPAQRRQWLSVQPPPGAQWALVPRRPLVVEIPTASPLR